MNLSMNINILILQSTKFSILTLLPFPTCSQSDPRVRSCLCCVQDPPWVHLIQSKSQSSHHDPGGCTQCLLPLYLHLLPLFPAQASLATLLFLQSSFPFLPQGLCTYNPLCLQVFSPRQELASLLTTFSSLLVGHPMRNFTPHSAVPILLLAVIFSKAPVLLITINMFGVSFPIRKWVPGLAGVVQLFERPPLNQKFGVHSGESTCVDFGLIPQ